MFRAEFRIILVSLLLLYSSASITDKEYELMPKLFHFDDFAKCFSIYGNDANYCRVTLQLVQENSRNTSQVLNIIKEFSSKKNHYRHDILRHGICVPQTCPNISGNMNKSLTNCFNKNYKSLNVACKIIEMQCQDGNFSYPVETKDIICAALFGIYIMFVLSASFFLKILENHSQEKHDEFIRTPMGQFISPFSISQHWHSLFNPNVKNDKYLSSIEGLRVIFMIVVMTVHTLAANTAIPVLNPQYVVEVSTRSIAVVAKNGGVVIQIYFVISAWLLTSSILEKIQNSKILSFGTILSTFARRFIRLTPTLAAIIAVKCTWLVHFSRGPFSDQIIGENYRICGRTWWKHLLYINNINFDEGQCLFQAWYLAVDTQLYLLTLLLLWLVQKKPERIIKISIFMALLHVIICFCILYWNKWEAEMQFSPETLYSFGIVYSKQWHMMWASTYSNFAGYAVGIFFGYIYVKYKREEIFRKSSHILLWWIITFTLIIGPLLFSVLYKTYNIYSYNRLFVSIFGSLNKLLFALGCALLIIGMSQGLGGIVRKVCEASFLQFMAQLTYSAFLIHFAIIKLRIAGRLWPPYLTHLFLVRETIMYVVLSYLCAVFLTILVERPFKALFERFLQKPSIKAGNVRKLEKYVQ